MENNKNSFEIIKQNRYEVMLNDFKESDIDFISESDYMYALEKAEVFTEAYFGKTKNVLAIEKAMGELYEAMNAEPYKTHAGTPLARNLEKAIKDAFGFKKVVLNITTTMYDLPLVFTMVDIERFSQASDIIISRKHGYFDSMGRHSVIIQISSTFASQYGLTAEEYTAMLLHEIGHSMDHTPYIALRTLLTIIANPFAILLSNRVTGGIFAAVVQWISNIITSTPVLAKINEWLTKAENIIARTAIPVLSVAALTTVPAVWAIGIIKLLRSAPGRKAEEFADSFAVSYGYGKELASALSKVDNRYTPNPRYNNALLNFMNDAGTAAGQILMIMSGDEHGTTTSRIRSMIDKAKRDLNRGNFNPEVKDMLIKDIENLEREYDIIRGIYSVEGSNTPITDILRGFLDKVFRGYPHIFARGLKDTYVVPTTEAVEGETDLDKIMGLLAHMNEFKYGFAAMSGKVFTGDILDKNDTLQTYYRTMPPNMVEKYQVAVCWDAVAYQANWFDANVPDIDYKCYYCEYEPKIGNSHTWMVFTYHGKKYVFEWSWGSKRGVKVISPANKNTMDIYVEDIPKSDHSPTELKSGKYVVMEYDPHKDPYGCTTSEFMNNKWYKGHIIKTNCKSKQEMKLVFQLDGILEESAKDNIATIDFPNNESIEYAKNDSELSRYVDTLIKDCVGEILVDKETEKMIGYAFVYGKKHKDHGFIFNVYLKPPYRGRGLGKKLISDAIHKYDGVDLTVKKNNEHAVDLYKKNGFVVIGDGNSKSEYYMKLKSKLTKDDVVEEACKDPRTARELAQKVKDLAKTYDANFFFVTDGASTTNNNGNPAVQTAREAVAKWEREHGFDDVENWGKNPDDFSQYHLARYTKADVEKIIKKIHDKTVKDKKEPTGNQNCLLCTWCLEANLRGIDILPRAVYSPSDKIFSFDAISIFRNPKKEKFNSLANFKSMVLDAGDNSRFYVHVNWKGSSGGHEFLVLNLSDKVYVADAQAGILHDIDSKGGKKYFTDINFSNSYTARVDLLVLDKSYLQYNEKKYQLEWDDERDRKLVSESTFTESAIFDHDNLEINMDKWKPGNPLWITGSSGDGKSTYSNKLAKEHNAYLVHLDLFLVRIARTREKYEKVLKDTSGTVIGNGSEMVLDYINQHPEIPWSDTMPGGWSPAGRDPKLWNDLFDWILKNAKTDPKYKDKLIIVEGCSITLMPVEQAIKLPVIIMGTSRLTGAIRRLKRDRNEHADYSIFKLLFREYKRETGKSLQALNKDKDSFEKNLKRSLKTTPYIGDAVTEAVSDVITESVVFNKKDIYRNLGKFKTGESNILLITGYSGSGKSTLAEGLSKQYKCDYIELDVLDFYIHGYITLDKVQEFEPALFDYIKFRGDGFIRNYPGNVFRDYIPFVIDWCERHHGRKFIIEGIQLFEIFNKDNPQEFFKKHPIIIKGTSGLVSSARAAKRNDGNNLKNFVYLLQWVLKDTKRLNNLTKFYSESVTETYGKVWMRMNRLYDID